MRIVHKLDLPWLRSSDRDAELFVQLAAQCLLDRFTGFELAAGKFPVAGVDLAFGARGQQETPIAIDQHAHRHIDRRALAAGAQV